MGGLWVLSVFGGYWLSSFSSDWSWIEGCCCSTSCPSKGRLRKHWFKSIHGPWRADLSHCRALLSSHRLVGRWSLTPWVFARRDWIQAHEEGWQQAIRLAWFSVLWRPIAERDRKCITQPLRHKYRWLHVCFRSQFPSFFLYLLLKTDFSTFLSGTAYPVTKPPPHSGFTISEHKHTLPYSGIQSVWSSSVHTNNSHSLSLTHTSKKVQEIFLTLFLALSHLMRIKSKLN